MDINNSGLTLDIHSPFVLMAHCQCLTVTPSKNIEIGTAVKGYGGQLIFYNGSPLKWNGKHYEIIKQSDIIANVRQPKTHMKHVVHY